MQSLKRELRKETKRLLQRNNRSRRNLLIRLVLLLGLTGGALWGYLSQVADYRFRQGEKAFAAGEYQEAADWFLRVQESSPAGERAAEALLLVAEIQNLKLNRFREALRSYLLLIRDYPDAPEVETALRQAASLSQERLGEPLEALMLWQALLERRVADGDRVQRQVADCYFRLDNLPQARIEFENLLQNYPQSPLLPLATYRLGQIDAMLDNEKGAAQAYAEVRERWPDSLYAVEAAFGSAMILERQGRLQEAESLLLGLNPAATDQALLKQRLEQIRERMAEKKRAI